MTKSEFLRETIAQIRDHKNPSPAQKALLTRAVHALNQGWTHIAKRLVLECHELMMAERN